MGFSTFEERIELRRLETKRRWESYTKLGKVMRLGYIIFLQVAIVTGIAYATSFHVTATDRPAYHKLDLNKDGYIGGIDLIMSKLLQKNIRENIGKTTADFDPNDLIQPARVVLEISVDGKVIVKGVHYVGDVPHTYGFDVKVRVE